MQPPLNSAVCSNTPTIQIKVLFTPFYSSPLSNRSGAYLHTCYYCRCFLCNLVTHCIVGMCDVVGGAGEKAWINHTGDCISDYAHLLIYTAVMRKKNPFSWMHGQCWNHYCVCKYLSFYESEKRKDLLFLLIIILIDY